MQVNVVIPMAGLGSRFSKAGFKKPKPFIEVEGMPMIEKVIQNLNIPNAKYILIGNQEHLIQERNLVNKIKMNYDAIFIELNKLTEGTACTVLFSREFINNENPLLIANSDQLVDMNINDFIQDCFDRNLDGSILCFEDEKLESKWSFAKINEQGFVTEVKEKVVISNLATVGIYLFSNGKNFVDSAIDMIINNDKVNNEYYTCPVYNYMIKKSKKIGIFKIQQKFMHGIGTPEDLEIYLNRNKSNV